MRIRSRKVNSPRSPPSTFVRPGPDKTPVPKVSFATRVGDLGCGVGYYK